MPSKRVLIVEDEFLIAEMLSCFIEDMGMQVCARTATADDAISLAEQQRPDLILMDVMLQGDRDGVDAALVIWTKLRTPVVFVTSSREPATRKRIAGGHPAGILFKPFQYEELQEMLERIFRG